MRPSDLRHNSMARSTAQSECVELSTGTKISRYTGTSPFGRGEYVSDETGCQVSGGTSCRPAESQTVMASTGQASQARSNRPPTPTPGGIMNALLFLDNLDRQQYPHQDINNTTDSQSPPN